MRQSCTLSRGQTSYPSPTTMPAGQETGAQIPGPGLGEGDTHLAARAPREQEETQPAAPWPWQEINKTNTRAISISTLGEGAKCQGAGGGRETQRRFTTFPLFSFTRVYTQVLPLSSLSLFTFLFYFCKCSNFPATNYSWPGYKQKGREYPLLDKKGTGGGGVGFLVKYFGCAFEVGFLSSFSRLCLCRGEQGCWPPGA